jgi:hypothetical protein
MKKRIARVMFAIAVAASLPSAASARFLEVSLDGALTEWLVVDRLYEDSEITDGAPLASTYSDVYVANDADYLYIGLKLKAASSIHSNWMHNLFIDTDGDSGTGYNAGWMSGGYDRLVQYGAGGGSYSIFSFTGSSQSVWSWNWLTTIAYAYNADEIEWAIPRSQLSSATAVRLQFLTEGGDVTVQTWAHQYESNAKTYTMAATPVYTVTVVSAWGAPTPGAGAHAYSHGTVVTNRIQEPTPSGGTQYMSLGWVMTGHAPASGSATSFVMTVTNHATLTWQWQTNVLLTYTTNGPGSISGTATGYHALGSTANLTATPNHLFKGWSGDVPAAQTNDNPLSLTMDQPRSVTANFGTFQGKFQTKTLDGSLGDWSADEMFYEDTEITDGSPLASTYSAVYAANDHERLYIALDLKANSTIYDNWTHHVFIDTDLNPSTGYNGGWMDNGYDVMVQYGASGALYSVFSFSGGTQSTWSWGFLSEILYAYTNDIVEWSIPRSALGGSTSMKIQLLTEGGDVGYGSDRTFAHSTESQARIYTMAATPVYTVTVVSALGTPTPGAGSHAYSHGTVVTNRIQEPTPSGGTQYMSLGWVMTGHAPASGSATSFVMTVTNHATLTWQWQTNVLFTRAAGSGGTVGGSASGYYAFGSSISVTATPNSGYEFAGWVGNVPSGMATNNPLSFSIDQTRSVTATFHRTPGRYVTITLDGSLTEWLSGDLLYADSEITDGAPLNSTYSAVYAANDTNYLYIGLVMKATSSIFSNWTHSLYIDTDNNPATGYNAGWMSGGYDRLVQYGVGGTAYNIFSFNGGTQSAWSWNFVTNISYAYTDTVIEWAVPRSALGYGSEMRLQFVTDGSGISIETWAAEYESEAKTYAFSPPGKSPIISPISDMTTFSGSNLTFTVTANDPDDDDAPTLTVTNKPPGASFTTIVSGTNRIGTFTWSPGAGDVGTHLVRFFARDDENNATSRLVLIYVGHSGESTNSQGIPLSQTNWSVEIVGLKLGSSGISTVNWNAAIGIAYDIYTSPGPFSPTMIWSLAAANIEADTAVEAHALTLSGRTNFVKVVPAGRAPDRKGVWGLIRPTVQNGWNVMSPPLDIDDLSFAGAFGAMLTNGLTGGGSHATADQIHAFDSNGIPYMLWLNASAGQWYEGGSPTTRSLLPGEGFMIYRHGATTNIPIVGPVGNRGIETLNIAAGRWNLIGLSQGGPVSGNPLPATLISGAPIGSYSFTAADQLAFMSSDGSWKIFQRFGDGTWRDLDNPGTPINTITMQPGVGYYYYRQSTGGAMTLGF